MLEARSAWKDSIVSRNFVVVSPMIASSIASMDHLASVLTVLLEVIKTLRELNLISMDNSGNLYEPINKLITFLIAQVVDKMDKDNSEGAMLPVIIELASEVKIQEYKSQSAK